MNVQGVLAIVRLREHEPPDELLRCLVDGGVDAVEVTVPTPGALDALRRWSTDPPVPLGAGTVRTGDQAVAALDAGAQFLVTPTTSLSVLGVAEQRSVPVVCGALTPTEIDVAWHAGAAAVKVFPVANVGGAAYVKAVREPLADVPLIPTGGVDVELTRELARLGCAGVGLGGALVSEVLVAERRWKDITLRAEAFVAAWREGCCDHAAAPVGHAQPGNGA